MSVTDGVKAVKQERRELVRRLRQVDRILAGFEGLRQGSPRTNAAADKPKKGKRGRKRAGKGRKPATIGKPAASLAAAAQDRRMATGGFGAAG